MSPMLPLIVFIPYIVPETRRAFMQKKLLWIASLILLVSLCAQQLIFHPTTAPETDINPL